MLTVTINGLPCVAMTPELVEELARMGENVSLLNRLEIPPGASKYARGTFLMHSDQAKLLASGDRTASFNVHFHDDTVPATVGVFDVVMYQIGHRPVHISTVGGNSANFPGLYAVSLVDARYFWQGILTTASFDVTTTTDRTAYYDETENSLAAWTWAGLLQQLAGLIPITLNTSAVTGTVGDPVDYLLSSDPIGITIDRVCGALGMVFSAGIDGATYSVVTPQSLNANAVQHNVAYLRERIAGGTSRSADNADGIAWLNAVMPSSVTVRFPRQIPTSTDTHDATNPPPLRQFYIASSTAGKPASVTGRSGFTAIVNDALWAVGPIGSETNAAALQSRADYIAGAFYNRYSLSLNDVRLMGLLNFGPIAGRVCWRLTADGAFTELHITDDAEFMGGNRDIGEGFTGHNIVGLGGIQTHKTFDGSLIISANPQQNITTPFTGNAMEVLVAVDGGADGDDTTFASWTYTIYNSSDSTLTTPLAMGLALENGAPSARFTVGEVVPAVDGALGIAQKNGSTWSLLSVDETRVVDVCETDPTFSAGAVSLAMVAPFNLMFAGANAALTGSTSSATVTLTAVTTIGSPTNGLSISGSTLTLSAGLLFTHFADAGNGTTVETDLYSDTIAAGQLVSDGNVLEIDYGGVYVSSGTATRQIKLYFGGTAIFDTGALTLSLSSAWSLYASIIRVSTSVVRYTVSFTTQGAALAAYTASGELTGLTLSGTNILKITGQAAGIGAASNDIVAKMGYINFKP